MTDFVCAQNCSVSSFEYLYLCRQPSCKQPSLCCNQCFKFFHKSETKKVHEYDPFNKTNEFLNFRRIVRLEEMIASKLIKALGNLKTNTHAVASNAFYQSDFFKELFSDPTVIGEYLLFRELFYGREAKFAQSPSNQFLLALIMFNQKKFEAIKNQLLEPSPEEQMMNHSFNMITKSDSSEIENFIAEEQKYFTSYCQQLEKENSGFIVEEYLNQCIQRENNHPVYFKREFEAFIEEKYVKNPAEKGLFTLAEYTKYYWENFAYYSKELETINYLNHYVDAYALYSGYCSENKAEESLLNFRMWKAHTVPYPDKIKNRYFLDLFILGFIECLIDCKKVGIGEFKARNWLEYIDHLQDFVKSLGDEFVDFAVYQKYFAFRKEYEKFLEHIKQSKQIIFNRAYAIEYMNKVFHDGSKISNKQYKAFVELKEEEAKEKQLQLNGKIQKLKKQLEEKEGAKFYDTIFNSFVADAVENEAPLDEATYFLYKNQILENVAEEHVKKENEALMMKMKKAEEQEGDKKPETDKIKLQISETEQNMHNVLEDEEEEEEEPLELCLCCMGEPEECQQPECQMMGYCVACSL